MDEKEIKSLLIKYVANLENETQVIIALRSYLTHILTSTNMEISKEVVIEDIQKQLK